MIRWTEQWSALIAAGRRNSSLHFELPHIFFFFLTSLCFIDWYLTSKVIYKFRNVETALIWCLLTRSLFNKNFIILNFRHYVRHLKYIHFYIDDNYIFMLKFNRWFPNKKKIVKNCINYWCTFLFHIHSFSFYTFAFRKYYAYFFTNDENNFFIKII